MSETIAGSVQLTHALDGPEDVEISKHYEEGGRPLGQALRTREAMPCWHGELRQQGSRAAGRGSLVLAAGELSRGHAVSQHTGGLEKPQRGCLLRSRQRPAWQPQWSGVSSPFTICP